MNEPRRHHYVPQFYLRRFLGAGGLLWVWDKNQGRVFQANPTSIATAKDFYRLHEFEDLGRDPLILEKQLSDMEGQSALITDEWLRMLRTMQPGQKLQIPKVHRYIVARFMAVQFLRTEDTRSILTALSEQEPSDLSREVQANLHTSLIWDQGIVRSITRRIREAVWIFARNETTTPFVTSDNPVAFRTKDNRMWLRAGFLAEGVYAVYPLAPDMVMFCHERKFWRAIRDFDRCLSPITMTSEMVESENSGQVFMAGRFVISSVDDFAHARSFAKTIGTDLYKIEEQ
jgi:hypothetical protein